LVPLPEPGLAGPPPLAAKNETSEALRPLSAGGVTPAADASGVIEADCADPGPRPAAFAAVTENV
jgi:hypothetical protein